jgi:acyl-CoA dehydrogenase
MIEGFGGMTDEALRLSLIFGLTSGSIFVVYKKWSTFYISILAGIFLLFSKAGVNTMGFYVFLNCFFFIPFLREAVITKPLLKLINVKKALSKVSETEKVAINAGGTWVDKDLFSGSPDLSKILSYKIQKLTKEEQDFLDNQTNKVCSMVSDWDVFESKDLTAEVWQYLKDNKFFGMLIPKQYGGLEFSPIAQSTIVAKLATRSQVLGITVMVPNSLGPGELFLKYGTEKQKNYYLPRLADGREVPAFGLTEPTAGSDATSIKANGVVFTKADGKLGIRLNFEKRYITLGGVATVIGLAFKLEDPQNLLPKQYKTGITCAIINGDADGLTRGRRHNPLGVPFINSPLWGKDIVINIEEDVIGGFSGCGIGWKMLMECLSVGRGVSLPAISAGGSHLALLTAIRYSQIRKQFNMPIAKFEGIAEVLVQNLYLNYTCSAIREVTASAITDGHKPSVINAMAKYHATEIFRKIVNNSMDILGGAGICLGPNNLLAHGYMGAPIAITVEGANIMTRSLMQFGQGLIRCHPYALTEIESLEFSDMAKFDGAFWAHIRDFVGNSFRMSILSLTRGMLTLPKGSGEVTSAVRKLKMASSTLSVLSDIALISHGGGLKRMEYLSGKFADAFSWTYILYCIIIKYKNDAHKDKALFIAATKNALNNIQNAFDDIYSNIFSHLNPLSLVLKSIGFVGKINRLSSSINARDIRAVSKLIASDEFVKDQTNLAFVEGVDGDQLSDLEKCSYLYKKVELMLKKYHHKTIGELETNLVKSKEDAMIIDNYKTLYAKVISVNHFELKTQFGK